MLHASRATAIAVALLSGPTLAADLASEEIVVTGSRIARDPRDSASPLTVISANDIAAAGFSSAGDAIQLLPANIGSEFNLDPFTQNLAAGTSNFNLRGLGLSTTLVLINGRRQTVSGGVADDGSTFVDINALMPLIMLDRLEVLKDGASALYGSDAVAGVANYITRDKFTGVEARLENSTTTRSAQDDVTVSGIVGGGNDRWHVVAAASYLHRSALPATDRAFTADKAFSSYGQPGSFILQAPSPVYPNLPTGVPIIDPACGGPAGGIPNPRAAQPANAGQRVGTCTFDFSSYYDLIPEEQRWNTYATGHIDLNDALTLFSEVGYSGDRVIRGTSPSFPLLTPVIVPADNPGNVFDAPAQFLGRALGLSSGRVNVHHASDTWRGVTGLRGDMADGWHWEVSGTYSANTYFFSTEDVLADRFIAALNGQGGPNNNLFFNPFGSSVGASPGSPLYNNPAVIANFVTPNTYDYGATLAALDASVTGKVGNIGLAFGGQLRRETFTGIYSAAYNAQDLAFAVGGPNFYGARTVWALFGEAHVPLLRDLEAQLALRHEDDGAGLSSTNPKVGLLYRPSDVVALRGSFSTAFRAPSVFQTSASQTVLENIVDPATQTTSYVGTFTNGSKTLKPETALVANIGATVTPMKTMMLSVDAWRYDYRNIIVKQDPQAIVNANPFDPRIIRAGGQILQIDTAYVNASSALADGLDLSARYGIGQLTFSGDATFIRRYLIQETPTSPVIEAAGSRNYDNFARSLPRWRGQVGAVWEQGNSSLGATVRIVSHYRDDQNNNVLIPGQATLDAHYTLKLAPRWGMTQAPELTIGAINLTDRDPPTVNTDGGYDSKVFDPRGRMVYVRIKAGW